MIYTEYQAIHAHRALRRLQKLYPNYDANYLEHRLELFLGRKGEQLTKHQVESLWDERDTMLITYGDMIRTEKEEHSNLSALHEFVENNLNEQISIVHLLPFFPWSSDDGFSVKNYRKVDESVGEWKDVDRFAKDYDLMFDLVLNHASAQSTWFREFLKDVLPYKNFFYTAEPSEEIKKVVRPRTHPLLTKVNTRSGEKHVWTTFSADQVDLNFNHPDLLFEILDILMLYIEHGARVVRLDAIAYLWKEIGTDCIHLENTHRVVKLFRDVLDLLAPEVILLTETNVPHKENMSYFGDADEANMVYNFSMPPLLLYSVLSGKTSYLKDWASSIDELPPHQTFLNFTASHDGIGVRPLQGLIPQDEFDKLVDHVKSMRGRVSYKTNADGSESPYELNITYYTALGFPKDEASDLHLKRFLLTQAFCLAFKGIPAVYFNSLFGTGNFEEGFAQTGQRRTLNRQKWTEDQIDRMIHTDGMHKSTFAKMKNLLKVRREQSAFHPSNPLRILELPDSLVGFIRHGEDQELFCLFNFTDKEQQIRLIESHFENVLNGETHNSTITLQPYDFKWLVSKNGFDL